MKRMTKGDVNFMGLKKAQALMCSLGVCNAKQVAHYMWVWLRDEEKRQKDLDKRERKR